MKKIAKQTDLKDELEGAAKYRAMAKKYPAQRKKFLAMAKDEIKHHGMLESMNKRVGGKRRL